MIGVYNLKDGIESTAGYKSGNNVKETIVVNIRNHH